MYPATLSRIHIYHSYHFRSIFMSLFSFIHRDSATRLLLLVSALAALNSCKKLEVNQGEYNHEISFSPSLNCLETKANTEPLDERAGFFTYAWYLPDGKNWTDNKDEAEPYINKETVSFDTKGDRKWKSQNTYYWPHSGGLTFFSYTNISGEVYAPGELTNAKLDKENGLSIIPFPNGASWTDFDLLVTDFDSAKDIHYNLNGAPTRFEHKLTKISFFVKLNAQTTDEYKLTGLILTDIFMQGEYYRGGYDNDYWEKPQSLARDYSMFKSGRDESSGEFSNPIEIKEDPAALVNSNNVIPQTLLPYTASQWSVREDPVKLKISYTKNGVQQSDIIIDFGTEEVEWKMGIHYKYNVIFGGVTKSDPNSSAPIVQLSTDVSSWL